MGNDFHGLQEALRRRLLAQITAGELTGLQLSRETGFRQAHISNFLNCKRGLSLEAMDAILRARKLTLPELMADETSKRSRRRSLQANSPGLTYIPLVDAEDCYANDIPYSATKSALTVMSSRLEKLPQKMLTPRAHWQRFIAMKVSADDAAAMAPLLTRGAVTVIDRHSNAAETGSIYVVKIGKTVLMRYVERVGREWILRAQAIEEPLKTVDGPAALVGRVCLVISEL